MRILLFGNPSTLHSNLAKGLREEGHEVKTISPRTGWRMFPTDDILLERRQDINSKFAFIEYLSKALPILSKCKNYDIVQLCNPLFIELRGTHIKPFYNYLRKHNKKMILGAFSDDYHIVEQMKKGKVLRYDDQHIYNTKRTDKAATLQLEQWYNEGSERVEISKFIAKDCDAIVSCLYEYWACYNEVYPNKNTFIPLPIIMDDINEEFQVGDKVKIFIGIQKERTICKGTDIMLHCAQDIVRDYPKLCELQIVENVPYEEYKRIMNGSDVILDQLYSYTPSMNSLLAMSKGIINIGGGEPESYDIINEHELRPIINVEPTYESVYRELKNLINHKELIPELKRQSVEYVRKHHDYKKVTKQYIDLYNKLLQQN